METLSRDLDEQQGALQTKEELEARMLELEDDIQDYKLRLGTLQEKEERGRIALERVRKELETTNTEIYR